MTSQQQQDSDVIDRLDRVAAYLQSEGFQLARAWVRGNQDRILGAQVRGFNEAQEIVKGTWQEMAEAIK